MTPDSVSYTHLDVYKRQPLDLVALAQVPAEQQGELHFQLHPAARLLESVFPILRIWQVNQDDYAGDPSVDLTAGGLKLLALSLIHI